MAKRHAFVLAFVIAIGALVPAILTAQAQTGTLQGTVKDQSEAVLPGVTVSVTSPGLQGTRETVSDGNGVYTIPALPPGVYTVRFELQGFAPVVHDNAVVPLGSVAVIDAAMQVAALTEVVNVTAQTSNALVVPTGQTNLTSRELNTIPVGRTPVRIAEFAPGLTDNTPNFGQVTISGAFAYDNVFLLNGVDLNDNLFGTANNVFIEDAIEETQVLTSGISAEYGRFSGGVINMVTKSGGNSFSGSVRLNFSNPAWANESPLQKSRSQTNPDLLSKFLEGTFGGPIFRDRVWFFTAGRRERSSTSSTTTNTNIPYAPKTVNDRYEIKVTGTPRNNHTVQGSYIDNSTEQLGRASINAGVSLDTTVLTDAVQPNKLFVASYNGVLGSRVLLNGQYSRKDWRIQLGSSSTALADSPFRARGVAAGTVSGQHYHAPFFSALDPEDRNNNQFSGSIAYFLTTRSTGTHNLKAGGESFTSSRVGGNSQSATNYVFQSDYLITGGVTTLDAQGRLIPLFVPGTSRVQNWLPTPGATMDLTTISVYAQDRWAASDNFSFDLGIRFERANSEATGDIVGADTHSIVPRLGMTYDPRGDGRMTLQATYAHYSGKYSDVQYARNTAVGSPSLITYQYTGPAGQGFDFAPGMNLANYPTIVSGNFPTANVFLAPGLESPITKELTLSAGRQFTKGYGRVMYTWRHASNFIEDFIDDPSAAGKIQVVRNGVDFGTFDRLEFRNSDDVERRYQAMQFIGRYDVSSRLYLNGHYTLQLENHGNFEGEAANQPANPSDLGDFPQILTAARNFPDGRLNDFQRSKVRIWAVYNQTLGRAGTVTLGPIWRYNSPQTYSLFSSAVPLSAIQLARNPGYARLPGGGTQTLYYGDRGTESFEGYALVDLAATYDIGIWKSLRPWIKFEVYNILDNNKLIAWNTAVNPDPSSPLDANGLPTGFIRPANFGTPRANSDYPRPIPGIDGGRTFLMAFGLRF